MRISKKAALLTAIYMAAGFAVMGGFLYRERASSEALRREVALRYDQAFAELCTASGKLDTALRKASCASSPSLAAALCSEVYAEALEAQAALGTLPNGSRELEHTASFLTRVGDYASYLSRSASAGDGLSDEDRDNLRQLEKSARAVTETLTDVYARLLTGDISLRELQEAEREISGEENAITGGGPSEDFKRLESEFPEFPTLIYDGPFSEHIKNAEPKHLAGEREITSDEAEEIAAKFLGQDVKNFKLEYERDSAVPVYVITRRNGGETVTVEVTKRGGRILYYGTTRQADGQHYKPEECVSAAEKFLKRQGFTGLVSTYWEAENGDLIINFAHKEGDVICYPDLIKVSVAMDTGAVSGYESLGYLMNHADRELPQPAISSDDAGTHIASGLELKKTRLALIPTAGGGEVLCHELLCEDSDGSHVLVYVNAETGSEEKILLLLEDESGTLTI